jgi:hypothetical protein
MKADYAKRAQVPQSVLVSHAAQLPPTRGAEEEDASSKAPSARAAVRWLRDFATVLDNVYGLPLDSSASSSSAEGRQFVDKGTAHPLPAALLLGAI